MGDLRIRPCNDAPVRGTGAYVLYWMVAHRRTSHNYALDRAIDLARELARPLLVFEPLRIDYPHASERLHRFVVEGMADNARSLAGGPVTYYPYLEPEPGAGRGLLAALAQDACCVVTDDYPAFFLPRMVRAATERTPVAMEAVDGNGLIPIRAPERAFPTAHSFRRWLQRELPDHLLDPPRARPLARLTLPRLDRLPSSIARRWPALTSRHLTEPGATLGALAIDRDVAAVATRPGGQREARRRLRSFVAERLEGYGDRRNDADGGATSGLSPYLHFGHIGSFEVFDAVARHEDWSVDRLSPRTDGSRSGWWGMTEGAEAFLDQLITWRELGLNAAIRMADFDRFDSLPAWAIQTLSEHAGDERPHLYDRTALENAETHDGIWNAAQRQLRQEGTIGNYLRMLWGKKILEWTETPREALEIMLALNDRYALDGRDPNSVSGIFWTLGRYDRAWGPERPIFGKVRYMSSDSTRRKLDLKEYLRRFGPEPGGSALK